FNVEKLIGVLDAAIAKSNLNAASVAEDRFITEAEITLVELKQLLTALRVSRPREEDFQPILSRFAILIRKWETMETKLKQLSAPFFAMLKVEFPDGVTGFSLASVSSKSKHNKKKGKSSKKGKGKRK
ncbi:hypothetical protein MKW94_007344, partial [Papaver nudicaule]|nr:hypothetical protein [Papaver nudicaule]